MRSSTEALAIDRFSVVLFSSFGVLGLVLAVVGIYGVMSFTVAQRTQEFGVRMALGAQRSRVLRLVLKEGAILAVVGATIGLGGAYLVGRVMQSTLYGVGAMDAHAFGCGRICIAGCGIGGVSGTRLASQQSRSDRGAQVRVIRPIGLFDLSDLYKSSIGNPQ